MQIRPKKHRRRWEDVQEAAARLAAGEQATGWQFHTIQMTPPPGGALRTFPRYKKNKHTAFLSDEGIALPLASQYFWGKVLTVFFKIFLSVKKNHYLSTQTLGVTL